ncbi:uncharacterized protein LOC115767419 isoform X1 [Drosophila novamexicana]|uniref:uncharacterized protein LOC115767419 isoform X1 n=1 Tax=Drosophila novamexicana TaxID=47314 RepID=UPI0011E5C563|nr:uncharacterized protein LOC115767419 isoform X1 [Drosophila novamexicana]
MFRVGKFNVNRANRLTRVTRRMSLAKRLLNASQIQSSGTAPRERMPTPPTSQSCIASKLQKKSQTVDQDQIQGPAQNQRWPRKIFSGIQPTGSLHLGNYLGAVRKWTQLQKSRENVTICIVDMHSITMPHNPPLLRENIFTMAATLLACGVDPAQSTLFVQSAVMEHSELNWILNSLTTMPRLAQLPQFKEKSRMVRDVPLGLFVYPVLQAADIMLYKATHVPVGIDQLQHIQLAQHLARNFNTRYGEMFPVCTPMIEENDGSRILSLREPSKKMSKSDQNPKGTINLSDTPDQIKEKIKKAVTDFTSDISYSPKIRPGVSNLVNIHAQVTGVDIATVVEEAKQLDTAKYKERVAEAIIEHLRPIREKINLNLTNRNELIYMLEMGSEKARKAAQQTMCEIKQRLGLGVNAILPPSVYVPPPLPDHSRITASQRLAKGVLHPDAHPHSMPHFEQRCEPSHGTAANISGDSGDAITGESTAKVGAPPIRVMRRPIVPVQTMRVEKSINRNPSRHTFKLDTFNVPKIGFRDSNMTASMNRSDQRDRRSPVMGFAAPTSLSAVNSISGFKYGNSNPSALASIASQVNAAHRQQEMLSSVANSAYYKAASSSFNSKSPSVVNVAVNSAPNRNNAATKAIMMANAASSTGSNSSTGSSSSSSSNATLNTANSGSSSSSNSITTKSEDSSDTTDEDGEQSVEDQEDDDDSYATVPSEDKMENSN